MPVAYTEKAIITDAGGVTVLTIERGLSETVVDAPGLAGELTFDNAAGRGLRNAVHGLHTNTVDADGSRHRAWDTLDGEVRTVEAVDGGDLELQGGDAGDSDRFIPAASIPDAIAALDKLFPAA